MDYVRLGSTGLKVSRLCLGTMTYGTPAWRPWVLDESASRPFFKRAIERGINFFDTADHVFARGQRAGRRPRVERVCVPRRGGDCHQGVLSGRRPADRDSRAKIMSAIDASLRRPRHGLRRPVPDPSLRRAHADRGNARSAARCRESRQGALPAPPVRLAVRGEPLNAHAPHGWTAFVSMQNHYNLVYREEERDTIPFCIEAGIGVRASPLAAASSPAIASAARRRRRSAISTTPADTPCMLRTLITPSSIAWSRWPSSRSSSRSRWPSPGS